jgi:hypothetical protein
MTLILKRVDNVTECVKNVMQVLKMIVLLVNLLYLLLIQLVIFLVPLSLIIIKKIIFVSSVILNVSLAPDQATPNVLAVIQELFLILYLNVLLLIFAEPKNSLIQLIASVMVILPKKKKKLNY